MRHHRLIPGVAALLAAGMLDGAGARAEETLFDFAAPGPEQEGDYVTSEGVLMADGFVTLAPRAAPDWWDTDYSMRKELSVQSLSTIADVRFTILLDGGAPEVFEQTLPDGSDIRLVDPDGVMVDPWALLYMNRIGRQGDMRVVYPGSIGAGFTSWYLYFGAEADAGDVHQVFTHETPQGYYMAGDAGASAACELTVISFTDANTVMAPGLLETLNTGETATIAGGSLTAEQAIQSTGPIAAAYTGGCGDALATRRLAGTDFVLATPRYAEQFTVTALDRTATVTFTGWAGVVDTWTVDAGTSTSGEVEIPDAESVSIQSDEPVVVAKHGYDATADGTYDYVILPPVGTDIVGGSTGRTQVVALQDATTVTAYISDGTVETATLDALGVYELLTPGNQGDGPAARIVADRPIGAISYADGDGGEMQVFLPTRYLGTDHYIPYDAQYVYVTAPYPSTRCTLTDTSGSSSRSADVLAPPYAKKLYWGSATNGANIPGPSRLECDMPVHVVAEQVAAEDEMNVWPLRFFRGLDPDLRFSWGEEVQTRFDETGVGTVTTPGFHPDLGVVAWQGFEERGDTDLPSGTSVSYLVSVDDGATWLTSWGEEWREASGPEEAMSATEIHETISTLPVDTASLTVQARLATEDGTITPTLDDIAVTYDTPGELASFQFGYIPYTVTSGVPFSVPISARDAEGYLVMGFEETVSLYCEPADAVTSPAESPAFVDGQVEFEMTLEGEGYVTLVALGSGAIRGEAGPITVMAAREPASLVVVGGDDQFGVVGTILPEPVSVQVLDADGFPVAGVEVAFDVTAGGGSVTPPTNHTDADGIASAVWTLGDTAGPNRLEADAGEIDGSPAQLVARADPPGGTTPTGGGDGGGCGCAIVH